MSCRPPPDTNLTKADTVALWHAVQWMQDVLREWRRDGFTEDRPQAAYEAERGILLRAKRALRKVNAIRKAQACSQTAKEQQPLDAEQRYECYGGAANEMVEMAKEWADNKLHVYQVAHRVERMLDRVIQAAEAAHGIAAANKPTTGPTESK